MPVAVARFSESTSSRIGMRTHISAMPSAAAESPGPSLPTSTAIRWFAGRRAQMRDPSRRRGRQRHDGEPFALQPSDRPASCPSRAYGTRSTLPIDVRIAFRYSGSQHGRLSRTLAPNAAALRNALPTLSASVTPSSTRIRSGAACHSASGRSRPLRQREAAAMQIETGDRGEIMRVAHVDGRIVRHARQGRLERLQRCLVEEHRLNA